MYFDKTNLSSAHFKNCSDDFNRLELFTFSCRVIHRHSKIAIVYLLALIQCTRKIQEFNNFDKPEISHFRVIYKTERHGAGLVGLYAN